MKDNENISFNIMFIKPTGKIQSTGPPIQLKHVIILD